MHCLKSKQHRQYFFSTFLATAAYMDQRKIQIKEQQLNNGPTIRPIIPNNTAIPSPRYPSGGDELVKIN